MRVAHSIAERIRAARELRGITQAELAKRVARFPQLISSYECSRVMPPLIAICEIAGAVDLPLDYFFRWGAS